MRVFQNTKPLNKTSPRELYARANNLTRRILVRWWMEFHHLPHITDLRHKFSLAEDEAKIRPPL
jgi:hypothetical protein